MTLDNVCLHNNTIGVCVWVGGCCNVPGRFVPLVNATYQNQRIPTSVCKKWIVLIRHLSVESPVSPKMDIFSKCSTFNKIIIFVLNFNNLTPTHAD